MNKHNYATVTLPQGEVHIYNFGGIRLHAYQTGDPLADEVFLLEKAGRFVVLESPCFTDSIAALSGYLEGKAVAGMLVAYHGAGASFLPAVPKYATASAVEYAEKGGGRALIDQFSAAFGSAFDAGVHTISHVIGAGAVSIGGIDFIIRPTAEAFDVEIPEINAVYTHMLGHDCHSIVTGPGHAEGMISQLKEYIRKGCGLILTSHCTPEDLEDAQTKIDYLEQLKAIAASCPDRARFQAEVKRQYPDYGGEHYLDMTAGLFFP